MPAYKGQVAVLHSRLLATLDTLDAIQAAHAEELSVSRRAQEALKLKLDVYCKTVREAEAERDDMRDAVLRLVEKVEKANNLKKLPYAQIQLSSHPGPASISSSSAAPFSAVRNHDDAIAYAASLLEAVRHERDAERKAHTETRAQAEACILALEAKLHRREAELEGASTSGTDAKHPYEATPGSITPRAAAAPGSRISSQKASVNKASILGSGESSGVEKIAAALDETVMRNKRLECEISQLYQRLGKARLAHSDRDWELGDNDQYYERANDVPLTPLRKPKTKVPINRLVQVHDEAQPQRSPRLVSSTTSSNATVTLTPTLTHIVKRDQERDVELLHGLEAQIVQLGKKIDAFARERGALAGVVVSSKAQERYTHKPRRGPILQRDFRTDSSESELDSRQSTPTHGSRGTRSFRESRVISPPPSPTPSTKHNQQSHNFELYVKPDPTSSPLRTTKPDSRRSAISSSRSSSPSPALAYPQSSTVQSASARLDVYVYTHAQDQLPQEQPQPQTPKTAKRGVHASPTTQMRASTSTTANGEPATGINAPPAARVLVQRGVQTELNVQRAAEEVHTEDHAVQTTVDRGDHERNEDRVEDRACGHVHDDDNEPHDRAHDDGVTNAPVKPDLPASPQAGGEQTYGGKVDVIYSAGHAFGRTKSLDAVGSAVETGISGNATGITRSASTGAIWTETLAMQTPTTPRGRSTRGAHTSGGSATRRKERATRRVGVSAPPRSLNTLDATPLRSHPFTAGSPHQVTAFSSRAFASFGGQGEVGDRHRDKRVRTDRDAEALKALVYEDNGDKVSERMSIANQGRTSDDHSGAAQEREDIVDPGYEQHDSWRAYEHEHESRGEEEGEMSMELESEKGQSIMADNEGEQSMELATPLMGVCDIPDEGELDENADAGLTGVGAWATDGGDGESEYLEEHDIHDPTYELIKHESDSGPKEELHVQVSEAHHDNWYSTRQKDKQHAHDDDARLEDEDNTNKHVSVRSTSPRSPASSSTSTSPTLAPQPPPLPPPVFLALAQPLAHRPLTGAHAFPYLHPYPDQGQRTVSAPAPALAITIPRPASGHAYAFSHRRLHDPSNDAQTHTMERERGVIAQDAHNQSSPVVAASASASASARASTGTQPEGHPQPSGKAHPRTPVPTRTRTPSRTQSRTPLIGTPSRTGTPLLIGTPLIGTPLIGTPLTPSRSLYQATSSFVAELRQVDMMLAAAAAREQEHDRS